MKKFTFPIVALLGFGLVWARPHVLEQLRHDMQSGAVSRIQGLEYSFFAYFARDQLPSQYQSLPLEHGPRSLTPLLVEMRANWDQLGEEARKLYRQRSAIPTDAFTWTSLTGNFVVYYYTSGDDSVPFTDVSGQAGTPDYVEMVGAAFDSAWKKEVVELGYPTPNSYYPAGTSPSDTGKYRVVLRKLAPDLYGLTWPMGRGSYMELRNNYQGFQIKDWKLDPLHDYEQNPDMAIQVTAAHEYFHTIQMGLVEQSVVFELFCWSEGTAVYMEETVYPHINDYLQYIHDLFFHTSVPLHSKGPPGLHGYATCVWPLYLRKRFGHSLIRDVWQRIETSDTRPYEALEAVLGENGSGLTRSFQEFATWCFFTNDRADTVTYFPESHLYPPVWVYDTISAADPTQDISDTVLSMAFQWYIVNPGNSASGTIEFVGQNIDGTGPGSEWAATAIAYDSTGDHPAVVYPIALNSGMVGSLRIPDWYVYPQVALVAVNANPSSGQKFRFGLVSAEYDTIAHGPGELVTISQLDGRFLFSFTTLEAIQTTVAFTRTSTNPDSGYKSLYASSFDYFYSLECMPDVSDKIENMTIRIRFNQADQERMTQKRVRLEELGGYVWNDTTSEWNFIARATVSYLDSSITLSVPHVSTFGFFRSQTVSTAFKPYPSPARFKTHSTVFFPLELGRNLYIYTLDGLLVRHLCHDQPEEWNVNGFVWDGKNEMQKDVGVGIFYYAGRDSTGTWHRGKMVVAR